MSLVYTNQTSTEEEIKSRLKSANAFFFYPARNILYSSLLSQNIEIKIYRTIILPVVLHGRENLVSHIEGGT